MWNFYSAGVANQLNIFDEMQIAINETKEAIDEANLALLEYEKTMRELEWEQFDYQQERISNLTDEADFMIDLMDNSDLHDESGKLTDDGMAVVGLHGQNYNVYMAQADRYAEEIKKLDEEIAKDPNNVELIERREELLELQRESILAAEDEKQAIADLVEEGINRELEALREVIDTYKDALDSAKDLYDYRKKIADQTKKIAEIEKQLSAYENDLSEETKATVQKLKVELEEAKADLEETEYDKYISDQKKLLDDLYERYETTLNQRLDNVDVLVEEMIGSVNANTDSINATLTETADSVGYTMTDSMQSIWDGSVDSLEGTIGMYGDNFNEKLTAINIVLNDIEASIEEMVRASDAAAEQEIANQTNVTTVTPGSSTETKKPAESTVDVPASEKADTSAKKEETKKTCNHMYAKTVVNPTVESEGYTLYICTTCGHSKKTNRTPKLTPVVKNKNEVLTKYATGGLVDYTGPAWVDGTPAKPEMVLNPTDTANFIDLKEFLRELASKELDFADRSPFSFASAPQFSDTIDFSSILSSIMSFDRGDFANKYGDFNITIPIEHIEDYNDFVNQLKNDKKFERMIQDITVNRLSGGSQLAKNRHRWG